MPNERVEDIRTKMDANSAYAAEMVGMGQWYNANKAEIDRAKVKMPQEDLFLFEDELEAVRLYGASQGFIQRGRRAFAKKWEVEFADPQRETITRGLLFTKKGLSDFGKGAFLGAVHRGSFGAMDIQPAFPRATGPPEAIMWEGHKDSAAFRRLPLSEQLKVERREHPRFEPEREVTPSVLGPNFLTQEPTPEDEFFEPVYLPIEHKLWAMRAGANWGGLAGTVLEMTNPLIGIGKSLGRGAVARALGPRMGSRAGKAALRLGGHAGIALPFVAGEAAGGIGAGRSAREIAGEAAWTFGTFTVLGAVFEAASPLLRKFKRSGEYLGKRLERWARSHPSATPAEEMIAAKRMVKEEIATMHPSVKSLMEAEWKEIEASIVVRTPRPVRPQFVGEKAAARKARQGAEFEALLEDPAATLIERPVAGEVGAETLTPKTEAALREAGVTAETLTDPIARREAVTQTIREASAKPVKPSPPVYENATQEATANREQLIEDLAAGTGIKPEGQGRKVLEQAAAAVPDEQLVRPALPAPSVVPEPVPPAAREAEIADYVDTLYAAGHYDAAEAGATLLEAAPGSAEAAKAVEGWYGSVVKSLGTTPKLAVPIKKPSGKMKGKPGAVKLGGGGAFGKPPKAGTYLGDVKVWYGDTAVPAVKGAVGRGFDVGRRVNALLFSSVDASLRGAPNRVAGAKATDSIGEVTIRTAMEASNAYVEKNVATRGLSRAAKDRIWHYMAGGMKRTGLRTAGERAAADTIRTQIDRSILEYAAVNPGPIRVVRPHAGLGLTPTPEATVWTGIALDRSAYVKELADGSEVWTTTVKELLNAKTVRVILPDGTKAAVPRDVLALPMREDYFFRYFSMNALNKQGGAIAKWLEDRGHAKDPDEAKAMVDYWRARGGRVDDIGAPLREMRGGVRVISEFAKHRVIPFVPQKWLVPADQAYAHGLGREWNNLFQIMHLGVKTGPNSLGAKLDLYLAEAYAGDAALARGWGTDLPEATANAATIRGYMAGALERGLGRWDEMGEAWFWGVMRGVNASVQLHSVAVTNVPQVTNAAILTSDAKALRGLAASAKALNREEVARSGAIFYTGWAEMLGLERVAWARKIVGNVYGLSYAERGLRTVSALAGKYHAEDMTVRLLRDPHDAAARKELKALGLNATAIIKAGRLTTPMRHRAMQTLANKSQFLGRPKDLPVLWSTPWGRTLFQYKTFVYEHTRMLKDAYIKATPAQRLRIFTATSIVYPALLGEPIARTKAIISGRAGTGDDLERVAEAQAAVATFGFGSDLFQNIVQYGGHAELADPPVLGMAQRLEELALHGVKRGVIEPVLGQRPGSESERAFEDRQARRELKRGGGLLGLPGTLWARYTEPPMNVADESLKRRWDDVLDSNSPWNMNEFMGRGPGLGRVSGGPIPLRNMTQTRRRLGQMNNTQKMNAWRQMTPTQQLAWLTLDKPESSARWVRKLKPSQIQFLLDGLSPEQSAQLGDVMERAAQTEIR